MEKYHEIQIVEMKQSFLCREDEIVLEAMRRWRCGTVRCGCFGGGCGVCKVKVLSGDYCVIKKMSCAHITEQEKEKDIVLMCCIKPSSDLVMTGLNKKLYNK